MSCCGSCLSWITFAIIALVLAVRFYYKLSTRRNGTYTTLIGKTTIVTGANTGIGYPTALDFAMRGARVILACRSREKAEEAQQRIIKATGNPNVLVKLVDFQSLDSVRQFAKDFNETEERLDILVNNAGAVFLGDRKTKDGLHVTMQTNHFGPFLLTLLLTDKLKHSAPSRIVNVSSLSANFFAKLDLDDLNGHPKGGMMASENRVYGNAKLCNICCSVELAKRLGGTGVDVNSLNPGFVKTDAVRTLDGLRRGFIVLLHDLFARTPEEGAQTTVYVALSKDIAGITGKFFDNCRQVETYAGARDAVLIEKIWAKSVEFVKLRRDEIFL